MNSLILRTVIPLLVSLMVLFSIFVLLRGHNLPGGGFIGGLVAASAMGLYMIATGSTAVRAALPLHPMSIAGIGLFMAALSGVPSFIEGVPFLTGLWWLPEGIPLKLFATPVMFDIGVYLVVVGTITAIALALEEWH